MSFRAFRRPGFTLFELVLVLVIIGIIAGLVSPRYSNAIANFQVAGAARRIATDLALAKRRATMTGTSQTVEFDPPDSKYTLPGIQDFDNAAATYAVDLSEEPYHTTIILADFGGDTEVIFDGYGVPDSGGSVVIDVGGRQVTVSLDAATGEASVN